MLGGSFNPVHNGHVALARAVRDQLGYDRVVLVPANISPGKQTGYVAEGKHRLAMLRLAVSVDPGLCTDDCELARGGVSWSIDTLRYLSERYGKDLTAPIGLIIGQDLAASFGNWKEAAVIARDYTLLLAVRPPWKGNLFIPPCDGRKSADSGILVGNTFRNSFRRSLALTCPGAGWTIY